MKGQLPRGHAAKWVCVAAVQGGVEPCVVLFWLGVVGQLYELHVLPWKQKALMLCAIIAQAGHKRHNKFIKR